MAHSPDSVERRARLIREMARPSERAHSRSSAASSAQSLHQDDRYDTETQRLPALQSESNFQINTSALRRAFPDFSQCGSSEEDSIELGRGIKRNTRPQSNNVLQSTDISENLSLDLGPAGLFRITGTPPIKPRDTGFRSNPSASNASENNAPPRRIDLTKEKEDPSVKTTDFVSGSSNKGSSKGSQNGHRSLAELHARVDSDDSEVLNDGRPAAFTASTKNTRFGVKRIRQTSTITQAPSIVPDGAAERRLRLAEANAQEQDVQNMTATSNITAANGTHHSYLLPDIANITELVSGTRQDGTPLFLRSGKTRSRFSTPSQTRRPSALKQAYVPIESVPIPADQQALQLCLQLLQDKVDELQHENEKSERALDEYELEVLQLRSKLEERQLTAEQIGSKALKNRQVKGTKREDVKSALDISMKSLQDRLDRANRKLSASEITINNLTKDRHAAHQQLEVAYSNSEELRTESQAVRGEIEAVKQQVTRLTQEHEDRVHRLTRQEMELRAKIERRESAINEMGSLAKELWTTRKLLGDVKTSMQRTIHNDVGFDKIDNPTQTERSFSRSQITTHPYTGGSRTNPSQSALQDEMRDQTTEIEATTDLREHILSQRTQESNKDLTYQSFMHGDEISKLRELLEEDQALLKKSGGHRSRNKQTELDGVSDRATSQNTGIPRKSSLKHTQNNQSNRTNAVSSGGPLSTGSQTTRDDAPQNNNARSAVSFPQEKEDTQRSILSQRSERPRRSTTTGTSEMTSAFILPDITLTGEALTSRTTPPDATAGSTQRVSVLRPSPVSDRMPIPGPGEEDATIRPAQPPGLALATVLQALEGELSHLRAQVAQQETLYHQHDPALSRRKRKIVFVKLQKLLAIIDKRADQIYALYDVLEGQKEKGQLMPEEEVELTLQSIGIDPVSARKVSGMIQNGKNQVGNAVGTFDGVDEDGSGSGNDSGDDFDLPWEGFEATQTQTLGNLINQS